MQTKVNQLVNVLFNRGETRTQIACYLKTNINYLICCEIGSKELTAIQMNTLINLVNIQF